MASLLSWLAIAAECNDGIAGRKYTYAPKCRGTTSKRTVEPVAPTQQSIWAAEQDAPPPPPGDQVSKLRWE